MINRPFRLTILGMVFLFFIGNTQNLAQSIRVSGRVLNIESLEPVGFANVRIKNSSLGTQADSLGYFDIRIMSLPLILQISSVGFFSKEIVVSSESKGLTFFLVPNNKTFEEFVVKPKENPAWAIVRKVLENAPYNNPAQYDFFSVKGYSKFTIDSDLHYQWKKKPFFLSEDQIGLKAHMLFEEAFYLYHKTPDSNKEIVFANHNSTLNLLQTYFNSLPRDLHKYYFYDELYNFYPLRRTFLNPFNSKALKTYDWLLLETPLDTNSYFLAFSPVKSASFNGFKGKALINKKDWAIEQMDLSSEYALSTVQFDLKHTYAKNHGKWFPTFAQSKFYIKTDTLEASVTASTYFDSLNLKDPIPNKIFDAAQREVLVTALAFADSSFESYRIVKLNQNERIKYKLNDTLLPNKVIRLKAVDKQYARVLADLNAGALVAGKWELNLYNALRFNVLESMGFNIDIRRSLLSKPRFGYNLVLGAGIKDLRPKYTAKVAWYITKDRFNKLELSARRDIDLQSNFNGDFGPNLMYKENTFGGSYATNANIRFFKYNFTKSRIVSLYLRPFNYNQVRFRLINRELEPINSNFLGDSSGYSISEFETAWRFAYKELINRNGRVETVFNRYFPVVVLKYNKSLNTLKYNYNRLGLNSTFQFRFKTIGQSTLNYDFYGIAGRSFPSDLMLSTRALVTDIRIVENIYEALRKDKSKRYINNVFSINHDFNNFLIKTKTPYSKPQILVGQSLSLANFKAESLNTGFNVYSSSLNIRNLLRIKVFNFFVGVGPGISYYYGSDAPKVKRDRWQFNVWFF